MQTERESKPALMAPSSSTEHSGDQQPRAGAVVVKRKRTKRPRHHPPASSSSSASSSESTTTEEEDMAHCLILLAQGGAGAVVDSKPSSPPTAAPPPPVLRSERYTSRRYTADGVKAVYECRTCSKCFPTFQALGGHRASHKKPRLATTAADDEEIANAAINVAKQPANKPSPPLLPPRVVDIAAVFPDVTTALSLSNSHTAAAAGSSRSKLLRVHECSICRAEFASGQALGGHMRRHRPLNAPERAVTAITMLDTKKEEGSASINLELLDLNLPAPPDEEEAVSSLILPAVVLGGLGQFNDGKEAGLMLTASALVDCHY